MNRLTESADLNLWSMDAVHCCLLPVSSMQQLTLVKTENPGG